MTRAIDAGPTGVSGFRHEVLFYSDDREFLAGTLPFVVEGVDSGEAVLVVVPEPRLTLLRDALGAAAAHVIFADMRMVGLNPARIIPVWRDFVDRHGSGGRAVRGVGEPIWAGRTDDEIVECQIHESLLNVEFDGAEVVTILCPYDHAALETSICDEAHRSHAWLRGARSRTQAPGSAGRRWTCLRSTRCFRPRQPTLTASSSVRQTSAICDSSWLLWPRWPVWPTNAPPA